MTSISNFPNRRRRRVLLVGKYLMAEVLLGRTKVTPPDTYKNAYFHHVIDLVQYDAFGFVFQSKDFDELTEGCMYPLDLPEELYDQEWLTKRAEQEITEQGELK